MKYLNHTLLILFCFFLLSGCSVKFKNTEIVKLQEQIEELQKEYLKVSLASYELGYECAKQNISKEWGREKLIKILNHEGEAK